MLLGKERDWLVFPPAETAESRVFLFSFVEEGREGEREGGDGGTCRTNPSLNHLDTDLNASSERGEGCPHYRQHNRYFPISVTFHRQPVEKRAAFLLQRHTFLSPFLLLLCSIAFNFFF